MGEAKQEPECAMCGGRPKYPWHESHVPREPAARSVDSVAAKAEPTGCLICDRDGLAECAHKATPVAARGGEGKEQHEHRFVAPGNDDEQQCDSQCRNHEHICATCGKSRAEVASGDGGLTPEQFYKSWPISIPNMGDPLVWAFEFAEAYASALRDKNRELERWKESAMVQLGKADRLKELLPKPKYWGWDVYDATVDYVKVLESQLADARAALNKMLVHFVGDDKDYCPECGNKINDESACDTCYVLSEAIRALAPSPALSSETLVATHKGIEFHNPPMSEAEAKHAQELKKAKDSSETKGNENG